MVSWLLKMTFNSDPPATISHVLGWQACATRPPFFICSVFENAHLEMKPACGDGSPVGANENQALASEIGTHQLLRLCPWTVSCPPPR